MLRVSGTTALTKISIYKCKSLLTNLRKKLNHGTDYYGITLILFLFILFIFKPNNPNPDKAFRFVSRRTKMHYWRFKVLWEIKILFSRQLCHKDPALHVGLHLNLNPVFSILFLHLGPMKPHLSCNWYLTSFVPIWCLISCLSSSDVLCKMFLSSNSFLDGLLPSLIARVSLGRILLAKEPEERRRRVDSVNSYLGYRHKFWVRTQIPSQSSHVPTCRRILINIKREIVLVQFTTIKSWKAWMKELPATLIGKFHKHHLSSVK